MHKNVGPFTILWKLHGGYIDFWMLILILSSLWFIYCDSYFGLYHPVIEQNKNFTNIWMDWIVVIFLLVFLQPSDTHFQSRYGLALISVNTITGNPHFNRKKMSFLFLSLTASINFIPQFICSHFRKSLNWSSIIIGLSHFTMSQYLCGAKYPTVYYSGWRIYCIHL